MDWDPFIAAGDEDFYRVNSLYFDSPDYHCFWEKEAGVGDRRKLRLRFYGDPKNFTSQLFFEIKRKQLALVIKDRIVLSKENLDNYSLDHTLSEILRQEPDNEFLQELMWLKSRYSMQPKLFITYKRKALFSRSDRRFRVTFDYDIAAHDVNSLSEAGMKKTSQIYPGGVVLEVKYNNMLPAWFHQIIQQFQLQVLAYSKYANSLRNIHPRFDDNNYILPQFNTSMRWTI